MRVTRLSIAALTCSVGFAAQAHEVPVEDIETTPSWYGEKFDLIYDGQWVEFGGGKAHLDDDDLLFVGGKGTYEGPPYGVRFVTGEAWEQFASTHKVRITFTVKSATGKPLRYKLMYVTNEVGASGWNESIAGKDFTIFSFDYSVPQMNEGNSDTIVMVPDIAADSGGVLVKSATIELVEK